MLYGLEKMRDEAIRAVDDMTVAIEAIRKGNLPDALRYYKDVKDAYELAEVERKKVGQLIEDLSRTTIPDMMDEQGVKTITLEDIGYRFTVAQRWSCTIVDKDKGIPWLKENGAAALVFETVNAQTLSSYAKGRVEDEGFDLPVDIFKTGTMNYTSVTRAGKAKG